MEYRISERALERIIEEAARYGMRAGEMKVMGVEGWRQHLDEATRAVMSNAKSTILQEYARREDGPLSGVLG